MYKHWVENGRASTKRVMSDCLLNFLVKAIFKIGKAAKVKSG